MKYLLLLLLLSSYSYCFAQYPGAEYDSLRKAMENDYHVEDSILIVSPAGVTLTATLVRAKRLTAKVPGILFYTIYANPGRSLREAKSMADHGYAGIVANARGKYLSRDSIRPYEKECEDVNVVIDWISRQSWCDGAVAMYGGSYSGFAQWAATKHLHPALKTIVPYVAAIPGQGLPMENNVFLTANYQWAFYVTNNRFTDNPVNNDNDRWQRMRNNWYHSGAAFNKIDSIDGTPSPWLQKWLSHPDYDAYFQAMVPWKEDFAAINIPVLTIEGYYDDGQISGLEYLYSHYRYNPAAEHYLIIGPYDHFGTQTGGTAVLRGYKVDSAALINTREITFQWLDYVLKGAVKPAILKDKINFEVMETNSWRHVPSIEKMHDTIWKFYLDSSLNKGFYSLNSKKQQGSIRQTVDLSDKAQTSSYYPYPLEQSEYPGNNGLAFISEPLQQAAIISGSFAGDLYIKCNKKDIDFHVALYEVRADGSYFQLSYYLARASYITDRTKRTLLTPGKIERLPFSRSRMISKLLPAGSKIMVVIDIDRNPFAQVNYGTGKDVSQETIADAGAPLQVEWLPGSTVDIPILQ
ncbi:CocE/NonD family hydrolase [Chitinophaga sp. sic0106]|uniref:CocE/NonD family hydrolase n=1 Tax=Chitinophaga sp. sic0106 TaxID=2854785 RepID=UPI001C43CCC7|nr:CocE/NonD family hydrolase [Chitinophaga sp. sic0106]MBV7530494.1 CocE/NonD family hydrolase [Chitinophaga sp. sic0106]